MPEAPFVLSPPNAYDDKSDEELVRMAADGDREAFGALYRRYVRQIYSYILYRVQNVQEAEDLTARTFFRALQNIHRFEYRGLAFSAYLYRIAHNLVSNWHRDHGRARTIPLEEAPVVRSDVQTHPEWQLLREEERELLMEAIRRLPPERQHLLILKFVDGLSNAEIAQIMGRSEGAVKSLYHRTLVALRQILESLQYEKARRNRRGRHSFESWREEA